MKALINSIIKKVTEMINKKLSKYIIKIRVTDIINKDNFYYINGFSLSTSTVYENIRLSGIGIGNGRGLIRYPSVNDVILIINLFDEFIYLTNLYDEYSPIRDNHVPIKNDEMYIINKEWGSFIKFNKDDDLIINTVSGAKYKLLKNGGFKLFDKNDYGIESDGNGNITIFGDVTINGSINNINYMDNQDGGADVERTAYCTNSKSKGNF